MFGKKLNENTERLAEKVSALTGLLALAIVWLLLAVTFRKVATNGPHS